jgi:diguanylate cyclase (GGDEF)-like protein
MRGADTNMPERMHPLTLVFRDPEVERAFATHSLGRLRVQGRVAILVGTLVYLLYGLLDQWLVPPGSQATVWAIRIGALSIAWAVFALSFHPAFARAGQFLLALTGLAASGGLIAILWQLPVEASAYFYPGLVLATFYTYNFIGTRFVYALAVDIVVLVAYNLCFGVFRGYPPELLVIHNFFIVSANLMGGGAGYLAEYHKRKLYLREAELEHERQHHLDRALHDGLTGLPNRELLEDRIAQLVVRGRRDRSCHGALFVDLDGFKQINDTLGHDHGDSVLCAVARRLSSVVRQTDTVARIGGDEFFIIAHDIGSQADAAYLADKILDALAEPLPGLPGRQRLGASIGICLFSGAALADSNPAAIVSAADGAMYQAKAAGKCCYTFAML